MTRSTAVRLAILAALALSVIASLAIPSVRSFTGGLVRAFLHEVEKLGWWGPIILAASYVVGAVFAFPGLPISWGAGYLFGPWIGTAAASIGSTLGAGAAFLVGRTLARGIVEGKVANDARFRAIDRAVADQGFKIVLLIRLAPVFPFNVMNYAFGLTKVRFRDYMLASWIGMFPATAFNVYVGSLLSSLADMDSLRDQATVSKQIFLYVGLLATLVATIYVTRVARSALKRAMQDTEPEASAAGERKSGESGEEDMAP